MAPLNTMPLAVDNLAHRRFGLYTRLSHVIRHVKNNNNDNNNNLVW